MADFGVVTQNVVRERVCEDGWCPVCGIAGAWIEGPRGGMSVNVMCKFCGTRLNLTPAVNMVEWTHGPQPMIWGGATASLTPSKERAEWAKRVIEEVPR